jgi:endonuclease/exonuclease/phosphatase family metal-dependent hydrolase
MAGHQKITSRENAEQTLWHGRSGLPTLRVATWNLLHNHNETLERRASEAAAHLHDCDVILLQETATGAGFDTAKTVADLLGMQVVSRARNGSTQAGVYGASAAYNIGTAILTALPVHEAAAIDYTDGVSGQFSSAIIEAGSRRYLFLSAHFGWGATRESVRLQQAVEINDRACAVMSANDRIETTFFGGDLNTDPDSATSGFLRGKYVVPGEESFWVDSWVSAGEGPGFTQSPHNVWAQWTARKAGIENPLQLPERRIDYLYSRGWAYGKSGAPIRAEIRGRLPLTGIHASDHLGLVVDFETPESLTVAGSL